MGTFGDTTAYGSLRAGFRWDLPLRFNIGRACADEHAATSLAMIEVAGGRVLEHTFGAVTERSDRFANGLAGLGVGRGDRVAIMLPQGLACAVAHLATYKLGAIAVPLTQLFGPDALHHRLGDSGARVVVTDDTTLPVVAEVRAQLGGSTVVVDADRVVAPHRRMQDVIDRGSARCKVAETTPNDPALLIYTSGTTGPPKGALHGHRVLLGHLPGFELMFDEFPRADDRMWTPADWAWIGGLMDAFLPAWFHGRPVVATPRARFDPQEAATVMAEHGVTTAFLPPTALKLMCHADVRGPELRLRSVMSGGEPLGAEMLRWGRDHLGVTINEIYGQTEANLLIGNSASLWDVRPGSMGRPYPGHEVAILGADGQLAGCDTEGEIVVGTPDPVVMLRYWNQPDATHEAFVEVVGDGDHRSQWLRTGDIGRVDADGYFWFNARGDDVITSAGYRIGPTEIEACILGHAAVTMVAVVGVPDELRGQIVKAFVTLAPGRSPSDELADDIRAHVRTRLATYEYPREIEFVDELPLTTTGKIRRRELRDRAAAHPAGA